MATAISVEHLTKQYDLGVIGTGTISRDLNRWWARVRKQPDPYTRIGQTDAFERIGESILALDDVSFTVQQGEALGIIGRNGAGKSTLLKILSRVTAPTSGVVKVRGRIGSLLEVGTGFHPELTGRENVYLNGAILGMKKAEVTHKFDEIVDFAGVEKFIDTPVKRYSSGMYVRLAFAVAAHLDPEILIVDEVLAVGDAEFQKKCMGKMGDVAGEGRTVLFVSHNMRSIIDLCGKSILLKGGQISKVGMTKEVVGLYLSDRKHLQRRVFAGDVNHRIFFGPSEIVAAWIEDSSGKETYLLNTHDDIVFCLEVNNIEDNSIVGINVRNSEDQTIINLSNIDDRFTITTESGKAIIKVSLHKNLLQGGHYYVSYWVGDKIGKPCDNWQDVIEIQINDSNLGYTLSKAQVRFQGQWSVT